MRTDPTRPSSRRPGLRRALLAGLAAALGGCAISTPVRTPPAGAAAGDRPLEVSITHAEVLPGRAAEFNRWSRRVNAELDGTPGLLAHAIRRELLGPGAWTYTVWSSAEDRARFVRSTRHRRAMDEASTGIAAMRSVRLSLAPAALPGSWGEVLALLDQAEVDGAPGAEGPGPGPRRP